MAEGLVVLSGFSLGLVTYRAVAPAAQDLIGDGDQVGESRVPPPRTGYINPHPHE